MLNNYATYSTFPCINTLTYDVAWLVGHSLGLEGDRVPVVAAGADTALAFHQQIELDSMVL